MSLSPAQSATFSPWPHRMAMLLVCATFPLIWMGGLVTTYDAGMAVPDWPTTYNHGMFSYPWQRWLSGPWDLFVEHGHRQLGAIVGMLTIGLLIAIWWKDDRSWMRWLGLVCLLAVVGQGVLGGVRVLRDDPRLAMVHGCTGPLFFGFAVAMSALTSGWWRSGFGAERAAGDASSIAASRRSFAPLAWMVFFLAVAQLLLGAQLRHAPVDNRPGTFELMVVFHLFVAVLLLVHILLLSFRVLRTHGQLKLFRRPAVALVSQILLQLTVGIGTWVAKYNWPAWFQEFAFAQGNLIRAGGIGQSVVVTSHVAIGSLILVTSLLLAIRLSRLEFARRAMTVAMHVSLPLGVAL